MKRFLQILAVGFALAAMGQSVYAALTGRPISSGPVGTCGQPGI